MAKKNRDDFSLDVKRRLAHRVNSLCSNPSCRQPTHGPTSNHDGVTNVGIAAHITAASPGFARYDATMTPAQRKDISNGIWCCSTHAKMIDDDAETYSVELLRKWKADAEFEAKEAIEKPVFIPKDKLREHKLNTDQKSLKEIMELLPSGGITVQQLKNFDFGGTFDQGWFDDLQKFVYRDGPEFEFLDEELEKLRMKMMQSSTEFLKNIAFETFHASTYGYRSIPYEWVQMQPERFRHARQLLNEGATSISKDYENLLRTGRRKLGV